MPLTGGVEYMGTESDGSPASEYCMFCYQAGAFTDPDQTVDGMVDTSIGFMTGNLGFSQEDATRMSNDVIRRLKRWT